MSEVIPFPVPQVIAVLLAPVLVLLLSLGVTKVVMLLHATLRTILYVRLAHIVLRVLIALSCALLELTCQLLAHPRYQNACRVMLDMPVLSQVPIPSPYMLWTATLVTIAPRKLHILLNTPVLLALIRLPCLAQTSLHALLALLVTTAFLVPRTHLSHLHTFLSLQFLVRVVSIVLLALRIPTLTHVRLELTCRPLAHQVHLTVLFALLVITVFLEFTGPAEHALRDILARLVLLLHKRLLALQVPTEPLTILS